MKLNALLPFILTLSLALTGCATHRHRPHGGKLSEAMEKSSDTYEGERRIETPHGHHEPYLPPPTRYNHVQPSPAPPEEVIIEPEPEPSGTEEEMIIESEPEPSGTGMEQKERAGPGMTFCMAGGVGLFKSDDFHPLSHFDLSVGAYDKEHHRFELYAGLGWAQVDKSEDLDAAINDGITILSFGLRYKYFTTPTYTFLGHYITMGAGYTRMFWRYRNEIEVDDRTIGSDSIEGLEVFAGMGLHLAQTRHFQFGLEVLPGAIIWSPTTTEGFDNDVFSNPLMLKLRATISFLP